MEESIRIGPQPGPQEMALASAADIVIYGGAAGGGKTWALLLEPLRHIGNKDFGAVIFRHNANQVTNEGGLWDASMKIYSHVDGAKALISPRRRWVFQSGARISFAHIERDINVLKWQGTEIAMVGFDELTHFSRHVFFYMLTRNRTTCGVKPYVRATCNPDSDSWVADFISWWIDQDTGYPIKKRAGVVRWMICRDTEVYWGDTAEELWERFDLQSDDERTEPKSVTFIPSSIYDNKVLLSRDPAYLANLKAQPKVERERLLMGNWKIKPAAGLYFKRTQIGDMLPFLPDDVIRWVRGWDLAATSSNEGKESAFTSGVLIGKRRNGRYIVADVINVRQSAAEVRQTIKHTAAIDLARFKRVKIRLPQDPGQAGKDQAQSYVKYLAGYDVAARLESGSKEVRAEPMAAQWQAGNFDVLIAPWNETYFSQLESFPVSKYKDMVDAGSSAFSEIELESMFSVDSLIS